MADEPVRRSERQWLAEQAPQHELGWYLARLREGGSFSATEFRRLSELGPEVATEHLARRWATGAVEAADLAVAALCGDRAANDALVQVAGRAPVAPDGLSDWVEMLATLRFAAAVQFLVELLKVSRVHWSGAAPIGASWLDEAIAALESWVRTPGSATLFELEPFSRTTSSRDWFSSPELARAHQISASVGSVTLAIGASSGLLNFDTPERFLARAAARLDSAWQGSAMHGDSWVAEPRSLLWDRTLRRLLGAADGPAESL